MFWTIFAVIAIALLVAAWWIDHSRRRRGLDGGIAPVNPGGGYELTIRNEGGDPGGGGS